MIRVVVVDDQPLVRSGIMRILAPAEGFEVIAECGDGAEAVAAVDADRPDVVLMDIRMRGMDGIEATAAISARENPPPVLIITTFDDDEVLIGALEAGAAGFTLKESPAEDIIRATRAVADGASWIDPVVAPRVLASYRRAGRGEQARRSADELTDRENDVLRLVAAGATNTEIAADLGVSEATVKTHIGNIFSKLAVRDRAGAIIFAYDHGLVEPDPPRG